MRITFLGATQGVTGSKFLLTFDDGNQVLIDCGLFQGLKELRLKNWTEPAFDASQIQAIILTHAHIDHSGYIPVAMKKGFKGPIYCSPGTFDLCKILLPDAGYLQEEEARYANQHEFSKHHPALSLFTSDDAKNSLKLFHTKPINQKFEVFPGCEIMFSHAGHIIGATSVHIFYKNKHIVFSGDIGRLRDFMMKPPESLPKDIDYLVVESTYGDRLHEDIEPKEELARIANETFHRGGALIIPAFAVGRAQAILYLLTQLKIEKKIPSVPIYLNSPMATKATKLFCDYPEEHLLDTDECQTLFEDVIYVRDVEESIILNQKKGPMVIVAGSGMATGGRVIHHIKHFGPNPQNTILFVGYQAAGTRGQIMIQGAKEVKIHGAYVPILADVKVLNNLSAHADYSEIIEWLSSSEIKPLKTFIVHGEPAAQDSLRLRIKDQLQWENIIIPKFKETYQF